MADEEAPLLEQDGFDADDHRELGEVEYGMAESLKRRAVTDEADDPTKAQCTLLQALIHAQQAVYQELRSSARRQAEELERYEQATEVFERHVANLKRHAGAVSDHGSAMRAHASQMDVLAKVIGGHGHDLRDAFKRAP